MKKLLILMLILGMASAANAALVLSFYGDTTQDEYLIVFGDTAPIGIYNTDGEDYLAYVNVSSLSDYSFHMSNPQLTALAGDSSSFEPPYDWADGIQIDVTLAQSEGTSTPGIQFTWDLTNIEVEMVARVELWDSSDLSAPVDVLTIREIPEPATFLLLALGGLLLRTKH